MEHLPNQIALTGATGFTGLYILKKLLDSGYSVKALRYNSPVPEALEPYQSKIQWIRGDILDPEIHFELLSQCKAVIHAAALVSYAAADNKILDLINREGTARLVYAALNFPGIRFIHLSSIAALGEGLDGKTITEKEPWRWLKHRTAPYNLSKFAAETEVWRGFAEGLNGIILNPGLILGSGFKPGGSASIIPRLLKLKPFYTTGGTGVADVRDVSDIAVKMLEHHANHERYIVTGHNLTYRRLAEIVDQIAMPNNRRQPLPGWAGELAWRIASFWSFITRSRPQFTRHSIRAASRLKTFDNSKVTQAAGHQFILPEKTVADTLRDTGNSLKKMNGTPTMWMDYCNTNVLAKH